MAPQGVIKVFTADHCSLFPLSLLSSASVVGPPPTTRSASGFHAPCWLLLLLQTASEPDIMTQNFKNCKKTHNYNKSVFKLLNAVI